MNDNRAEIKGIVQSLTDVRGMVHGIVEMRGEVQKSDGSIYNAVISKTTAEWEANPQIKSVKNFIYVYTDYRQEEDPVTHEIKLIPRIKIGDGMSYVVDLPFTTMSITDEDIERWNNKSDLQIRIDDETHSLVFYNNV